VLQHDGWYYLMASAANCCAGPTTGYSVFAGRSRSPLGPFADAHIGSLGDHDLADFEALLDAAEGDVFAWLTGRERVAPKYATATYRAIVAFNAGRHEQD